MVDSSIVVGNYTVNSTLDLAVYLIVSGVFDLLKTYDWFVVVMAVVGVFSLLSVIVKVGERGLFAVVLVVVVPLVLLYWWGAEEIRKIRSTKNEK